MLKGAFNQALDMLLPASELVKIVLGTMEMPTTKDEWVKVAVNTVLDCMPGGKMMRLLKSGMAKKLEGHILKLAAKRVKKVGKAMSKSFEKIPDILLQKSGIDAHKLKKDWLGDKSKIARFDLYKDKSTGEILILPKGGQGVPIHTGEFIK